MDDKDVNETEMNIPEEKITSKINDEMPKSITCREDLTQYFDKRDNNVNVLYRSEVPQICKDEPCELGVDEAGRGPVLGPMLYGISYSPLSKKQTLVDLGCADSKTLTEEQRDEIFDEICKKNDEIGWAVEAISPNIISNNMYRRCKTSLNVISMNSAIDLIKGAIDAGVNVVEIYVDTVGKPEKYQKMLKSVFPDIAKIVVAKKADSTYPIVSAASICAKVSRDHALRTWNFREPGVQGEYGSGYPADPVTKQWLSDNIDPIFGFPQLVRFSWSTAELVLDEKAIDIEWEDVEATAPSKDQKISMFFTKTTFNSSGEPIRKKHNFFTDRYLSNTVIL